jgi:hypothetical protein
MNQGYHIAANRMVPAMSAESRAAKHEAPEPRGSQGPVVNIARREPMSATRKMRRKSALAHDRSHQPTGLQPVRTTTAAPGLPPTCPLKGLRTSAHGKVPEVFA